MCAGYRAQMSTQTIRAADGRLSWSGVASALLVVAIWSGFILVSRAGGVSPLTAWDVIAIRYATAGALLLPFWWTRRGISLRDGRYAALALVGGLGYALLAFPGFKLTSAAHAAVLLPGLLPFAVAFAAWAILGEAPGPARWAGLGLVASGVAILCADAFGGVGKWTGDLLVIGAAAAWACYTALLRRWNVPALEATAAVALLTALAYLPVYVAFLPKQLEIASWRDITLQAIYQGLIATILQMVLYIRTVAKIGATRMGMLMALVPPLAAIGAVPALGEHLTGSTVAALAFVVAGAWVGNRQRTVASERRVLKCPT